MQIGGTPIEGNVDMNQKTFQRKEKIQLDLGRQTAKIVIIKNATSVPQCCVSGLAHCT